MLQLSMRYPIEMMLLRPARTHIHTASHKRTLGLLRLRTNCFRYRLQNVVLLQRRLFAVSHISTSLYIDIWRLVILRHLSIWFHTSANASNRLPYQIQPNQPCNQPDRPTHRSESRWEMWKCHRNDNRWIRERSAHSSFDRWSQLLVICQRKKKNENRNNAISATSRVDEWNERLRKRNPKIFDKMSHHLHAFDFYMQQTALPQWPLSFAAKFICSAHILWLIFHRNYLSINEIESIETADEGNEPRLPNWKHSPPFHINNAYHAFHGGITIRRGNKTQKQNRESHTHAPTDNTFQFRAVLQTMRYRISVVRRL